VRENFIHLENEPLVTEKRDDNFLADHIIIVRSGWNWISIVFSDGFCVSGFEISGSAIRD
jgi:hypothetical protein